MLMESVPARPNSRLPAYLLGGGALSPAVVLVVAHQYQLVTTDGGMLLAIGGSIALGVLAIAIGIVAHLLEGVQAGRLELLNQQLKQEIALALEESDALLSALNKPDKPRSRIAGKGQRPRIAK